MVLTLLEGGVVAEKLTGSKPYHCVVSLDKKIYCVVPENIQTPTTEGIGNSRGVGGSEAQEIPEGRGVGP